MNFFFCHLFFEMSEPTLEQELKLARQNLDEAQVEVKRLQTKWDSLQHQRRMLENSKRETEGLEQFRDAFQQHSSEWETILDWNLKHVRDLIHIPNFPKTIRMAELLNREFGTVFSFRCLSSPLNGDQYVYIAPRFQPQKNTNQSEDVK